MSYLETDLSNSRYGKVVLLSVDPVRYANLCHTNDTLVSFKFRRAAKDEMPVFGECHAASTSASSTNNVL